MSPDDLAYLAAERVVRAAKRVVEASHRQELVDALLDESLNYAAVVLEQSIEDAKERLINHPHNPAVADLSFAGIRYSVYVLREMVAKSSSS